MRGTISISAAVFALAVFAAPAGAHAPAPGSEAVPARVEAALGGDVTVTQSGLYKVETETGERVTTHGPDLRSDFDDPVAHHGSGLGPGDPERMPVCVENPAATDRYQEVLYGYWDPAGSDPGNNRLATVGEPIRAAMRRMNAVLNEEALASSGGAKTADYIVRCESGEIRVTAFPVTTASGTNKATFDEVITGAALAGFTNNLADYTIFYDGDGPAGTCGTGHYFPSDSPGVNNPNNNPGGGTHGGYGVSYDGCWYGSVPMHENGHNQGAVQRFAPFSTGTGAHCWDENDVMCYSPDGGDVHQQGTVLVCNDYLHFDCGWDTYFDAAPEADEWLESHWNIGSSVNRFVAFDTAGQNTSPAVSFDFDCIGLDCDFTNQSVDPDGTIASYAWDFDDGGSATIESPSHTFAAGGTYDVVLTVTDDDGDLTSLTRQITVPVPPPPANDDFAAAEELNGSSDGATGTNAGATKQPGEPNHVLSSGGDGGASVWYRWTAPADDGFTVTTCGSDFDTLLAVYRSNDDINALPRIADNDDSAGPGCGGTERSEVTFNAEAGTSYRIAVDGYDSPGTGANDPETGSVSLSLSPTPDPISPPAAGTGGGTGTGSAGGTGSGGTGGTGGTGGASTEDELQPLVFPRKALRRGEPTFGEAGPRGSIHHYSIKVPRRAKNLRVTLDGPSCSPTPAGCDPDLDLYLGDDPDPGEAKVVCMPQDRDADERCGKRRPSKGRWYISVENVFGDAETEFAVKATYGKRRRSR